VNINYNSQKKLTDLIIVCLFLSLTVVKLS